MLHRLPGICSFYGRGRRRQIPTSFRKFDGDPPEPHINGVAGSASGSEYGSPKKKSLRGLVRLLLQVPERGMAAQLANRTVPTIHLQVGNPKRHSFRMKKTMGPASDVSATPQNPVDEKTKSDEDTNTLFRPQNSHPVRNSCLPSPRLPLTH